MNFKRILGWGVILYVFLLPWQTRWIVVPGQLGGAPSEFLTFSIYATDILLLILFLFGVLVTLQPRFGSRRLGIGIIAFTIVCLSSAIFANRADLVITSWRFLLTGLMLYWALQQKWVQPSYVLGGFVAGAIVQSLFGVGQVVMQQTPVSSWLGLAAHDPAVSGTSVVEAGGYRILRAYGSLPHPNILGGYLAIALLATFGLYLKVYESVQAGFKIFTRENIRRHIEGRQWYIKTAAKIAGLFFVLAVLVIGLLLTFSRSAWVGFAAAWLITLLIIWLRKIKWGIALWFKWSAALLIISGMLFAIIPTPFLGRSSATGRLEGLSTTMRQNQYQDAWALIKMEPLRGVGYGNMVSAIFDKIEIGRKADAYQPVHNIFILSAVELGIFGGLVFLAFCWLIIHTGINHVLSGRAHWQILVLPLFTCLLVIGLFDHYLWTLQAGVMLWWLVVGLAGREEG